MSQVFETVVTDISHLDFDPEVIHYQHPTKIELAWCGVPYPNPDEEQIITLVSEITCQGCRELYFRVGGIVWWRLRRGIESNGS